MIVRLMLLSLLFFTQHAIGGDRPEPPMLSDQYGRTDGLANRIGQPVLVLVTTPRKLRWIGRWEEAIRPEIPALDSLRIADVTDRPPPAPERVAEMLRKRVPDGISILIDLDSRWARDYELDTSEPCLVLLDASHSVVARFRGRPKGQLVEEVIAVLRGYFPVQTDT